MIDIKSRPAFAVLMLMLGWMNILPDGAAAQCRLCAAQIGSISSLGPTSQVEIPLNIQITANLDFSRLALLNRAGGEVELDPKTGQRRITGSLTDLGGLSLNGQGRLTGEPGRLVRVQLPERITLSAPNGSTADLVKLDTDLPPQARLDRDGRLSFSFGGKLRVNGNANGQFRGRIAITADYE
ncbi:MAG: DUF4402 domain-containing protein [Parasphingorhabdus sp.]|uniref:DUF4402 domain-containing protein n=1 Tax=Parasphingorhabdus sp. TaxID=2709688 RepID=UPI0030028EE7